MLYKIFMIMNYENVKFGSECREKIIQGVNLCSEAVQVTYGPNGKNSLIITPEGVKITKDGFHTAMAVNDKDPYITMGIKLVQDSCKKTAKDVGDATSTTAILINKIVNTYKQKRNPIWISRYLKSNTEKVLDYIKQNLTTTVNNKTDLLHVATIATNNDSEMGEIITTAFDKVGKDGIVTFEESEEVKDRIEFSEGFRIDNGYSSPYFINTSKNICELENVQVIISETKMDEVNKVVDLANIAVKEKHSLLLIAPEFDSEILVFLSSNLELLKSCTVISPNHKNFRDIMIKDMKAMLGDSMICKKVKITKNNTTFLGCNSNVNEIQNRTEEIRNLLMDGNLPEYEINFHKKRLANFTSGIATIYVGGYSNVEMKERYDRIEDAVCATQAALQEGIVVGGGLTLKTASDNLEDLDQDFINILKTPSMLLETQDKDRKELFENGIVEPFLVTKYALENAISTASMILTADVAIINMSNFYNGEM